MNYKRASGNLQCDGSIYSICCGGGLREYTSANARGIVPFKYAHFLVQKLCLVKVVKNKDIPYSLSRNILKLHPTLLLPPSPRPPPTQEKALAETPNRVWYIFLLCIIVGKYIFVINS